VTAAVFGLVGVVIGGLLSGGATYLMVRRQEGAELRQARRLVADELFDIALQLSILLEDRAMPPESSPMRDNPLPSRSWEMNKATLARGLSDKDWGDLPGFYSRMEAYRSSFIASGGEQAIGKEQIEILRAEMDWATTLYARLSGTLSALREALELQSEYREAVDQPPR
jgi:hypothetical protein